MRYKKHIIIICLFTFLFLPFQKYEQPKAFDLVITPSVIMLGAALALSTGVVISNQDQLQEIGHRVIEKIKDIPNAFEEVGDKIKINVIEDVLLALGDVISNLPSGVINSEYVNNSNSVTGVGYSSSYHYLSNPYSNPPTSNFSWGVKNYYNFKITPSSNCTSVSFGPSSFSPVSFSFSLKSGVTYDVSVVAVPGTSVNSYGWLDYEWSMTIDGVVKTGKNNFPSGTDISLSLKYNSSFVGSTVSGVYWDIPLSVDMTGVKDKYNEDKIGTVFPNVGQGSISIPSDTVYPDNFEVPFDSPTSIPGIELDNGVVTDVPGTDVGDTDFPNTDVGDTPVTGDSLWDTLFSWLRTLIQPIIDLLTAILGFFGGLLDKLKELLIELFVPGEGIFVDTFNGWKSDLEGKFGLDLSVIDELQSVEEQGVKDIEFTIMGVKVVLPLSFVNKFASTSRTFTTGLVIIFLVWYQYRNAYKLIRNSEPIQGDGGGKK